MMKSITLVAAAASLVAAQNLTGTPDCAVDCLTPAISKFCTPADDTACACAAVSDIGLAAVDCLLSSCDSQELTQAQSAGAQVCIDFSATAAPVASSTATATVANSSAAASTTAAAAPVTTGSGSGSSGNATVTPASSGTSRATATATKTSSSASSTATEESSAARSFSGRGSVGAMAVTVVAGVVVGALASFL